MNTNRVLENRRILVMCTSPCSINLDIPTLIEKKNDDHRNQIDIICIEYTIKLINIG